MFKLVGKILFPGEGPHGQCPEHPVRVLGLILAMNVRWRQEQGSKPGGDLRTRAAGPRAEGSGGARSSHLQATGHFPEKQEGEGRGLCPVTLARDAVPAVPQLLWSRTWAAARGPGSERETPKPELQITELPTIRSNVFQTLTCPMHSLKGKEWRRKRRRERRRGGGQTVPYHAWP